MIIRLSQTALALSMSVTTRIQVPYHQEPGCEVNDQAGGVVHRVLQTETVLLFLHLALLPLCFEVGGLRFDPCGSHRHSYLPSLLQRIQIHRRSFRRVQERRQGAVMSALSWSERVTPGEG